MKTKNQLFEGARKGPDPKYNALLQILDVITDIRNIYLHCVVMDEGKDEETVGKELKRLYEAEVKDG